jgi:hypothetical protein
LVTPRADVGLEEVFAGMIERDVEEDNTPDKAMAGFLEIGGSVSAAT